MLTVIDHANPWLSPSSTFAATIQLHDGAVMIRKGTGAAATQPAINIDRRENRSERRPANRLATAFASPNAAMNDTAAVFDAMPNSFRASTGRTERSRPTIP